VADRPSALRRATIALAWRPEWPVVVVVAMVWVALAVIHTSSSHQGAHGSPSHHGVHSAMSIPVGVAIGGWALGGWALMSVAMMVPVTLPAVRHVGLNSIRRRRWWAMAVYVASYVAVWVLFGVLALGLVWAVRSTGSWSTGLGERQLVVGALVIATLWQLTRWKRRAVVACQRTVPLPPTGWRADYGCAHFGVRQAGRCVISCWPLMLLMAVIGHGNLIVMAALTAGIVAERRASDGRRLIVLFGGALAAATVWTVLFG
jgi:predicted metal-binding membrane protein